MPSAARPCQARGPVPWARLAVFTALAAFILFGPLYRQALGGRLPLFRPWRMFTGAGPDICAVEYRQVAPDGTAHPLDRYALLGRPGAGRAPESLRAIRSADEALAVAHRLCAALGAQADVRVRARCATRRGCYYLLPVSTYSATMVLLYLAYLDPDAVHRFIDRLGGGPEAST
jgi:hypothetical protein